MQSFRTRLKLDDANPLIRDHSVQGHKLLPGLAYPDLLYQAFALRGYDFRELKLSNFSILQPLIVKPNQPIVLEVACAAGNEAAWKVRMGVDTKGAQQTYAVAEVSRIDATEFEPMTLDESHVVEQLEARRDLADLRDIYGRCVAAGLSHGPFMTVDGALQRHGESLIAQLSLSAAARADQTETLFHPALIDASAISSLSLSDIWHAHGADGLFVPLACHSFRAIAPIQDRCVARVKFSSLRVVNDLAYCTVEFFSGGRKIAELRDLVSKKVRSEIQPTQRTEVRTATSKATVADAAADVRRFLRVALADKLETTLDSIPEEAPFYELGLKSIDLLDLASDLAGQLKCELGPTAFFEHASIGEMTDYLCRLTKGQMPIETASPKVSMPTFDNVVASPPPGPPGNVTDSKRHATRRSATKARDIAIVSMAGRFPGAEDLEELWSALRSGTDCTAEIPEDRWCANDYVKTAKSLQARTCSRGGFIDDALRFDPLLFEMSPLEARFIDPHARVFLEIVWRLFESIGWTRQTLRAAERGNVGVYVGAMYQHYALNSDSGTAATTLSSFSAIANRVSHFFGLRGPSMAVDTACSSAASAIHLACADLLAGNCSSAVAGGVNLSLHPFKYLGLGKAELLSDSPDMRSFAAGNGYVPAECAGAFLLRRLKDAEDRGDQILAVVKSTAISHCGRAYSFATPEVNAQVDVMEKALSDAGVQPREIGYVEAAANGASLGDAVEFAALKRVFESRTSEKQFCSIGSIKSNIGHAEAASTVSQLAKVVLQLRHRTLVPSVNAEPRNPNIEFRTSPFKLQEELADWSVPASESPELGSPRAALINSFGAGGSYASLVVTEYAASTAMPEVPEVTTPRLLVLSAKNADRLKAVKRRLRGFVEATPSVSLRDLEFTLLTGREAMHSRFAAIATNRQELLAALCDETSIEGIVDARKASAAVGELSTVAKDWIEGAELPWSALRTGELARLISVPGYPFDRMRIALNNAAAPQPQPQAEVRRVEATRTPDSAGESAEHSIAEFIRSFLSGELEVPEDRLNDRESIVLFGVDSIIGMRLIRAIESSYGVAVTAKELARNSSIAELSEFISQRRQVKTTDLKTRAVHIGIADDASLRQIKLLERFKLGMVSAGEVLDTLEIQV